MRPLFNPNERLPPVTPAPTPQIPPKVQSKIPITSAPPTRSQAQPTQPIQREQAPPVTPNNNSAIEPSESKVRTLDVPDSVMKEFSAKEIDSFRQVFSLYDADNSGAVDRDELSDIMEQLGETPDMEQLDRLIQEVKLYYLS